MLTVTPPVNVLDDDGESVSVLVFDESLVMLPEPVIDPDSVWFAEEEYVSSPSLAICAA